MNEEDLSEHKAICHKKYYSESTNVEKRSRALQRYSDALRQGQSAIVKRKAGRPSLNTVETKTEFRNL